MTTIPADQIYAMVRELIKFPYPQICRHAVAADLLSALEANGEKLDTRLAKAVVQADDHTAMRRLDAIQKASQA